MNKKKILFIDDEGEWSGPYVEHLSNDFEVIPFRKAQDGLDYILKFLDVFCIVLDIMMPTPEGVAKTRTADGQLTGIWLLGEIRDHIVAMPCPVVVLTNKDLEVVKSNIESLGIDQKLIEVRRKIDTSRTLLPKIVGQMIARNVIN